MRDVERIGRYEVISHLATGGMGSVYLARSIGPGGFERHVVLKMLETAVDDTAIAMFLDEARVIGLMHHQHVAPAHELDRDARGRFFIVMDYVHGQTARAVWLRTVDVGLALPLNFTLTIGIAAASALNYAHSLKSREGKPLQIVHRDVSLSNLLIGYDGAIKLIDFGIAKMAEQSSVSQVGELKGTASYMAPEQCTGAPVDNRTDIFALGVVLYELATMKRAFRGRTDDETIDRVLRGDITPPSRVVENFPAELERIIMTALATDPAQRFQAAGALQRELEAFARKHSVLVGNSAIVPVMEVLFEDRHEPWRTQGEAVPLEVHDEATEVVSEPTEDIELVEIEVVESELPTPVLVERRAPTRARRLVEPVYDDLDMPTQPLEEQRIHDDVITRPLATRLSVEMPFPIIHPIAAPRQYPLGSSTFAAIEPAPRRLWKWLLLLLLALAGAACAIGILLSQSDDEPRENETPIEVEPATVAPVPAQVWLRVTTKPGDATVLLDGERLGRTPLATQRPVTPGARILKIRRKGYIPLFLEVDLSKDVTRDITLRALRMTPPAEPSAAPSEPNATE